MKGKGWVDTGIKIIKVTSAIIFIAFLCYTRYFILARKAPLYEDKPVTVIKDWTYYDEIEGPKNITTPYVTDTSDRNVFKFDSYLPHSLQNDSVIAFLNLSDIDVYVGNVKIYSWNKDTVPIMGGAPKNSYFLIDIPSEYAGSKISIIRYGKQNKKFLDVFVGKKDVVIRTLEKRNGYTNFVLSLFLLIFSFLIFLCSSIMGLLYKKKVHLTQISWGIFLMSCWLLFDSFVVEFVFRTRFIDGFMSYICTITMLFPFVYYLDDLQDHRYHKIYFGVQALECVNAIIFLFLHLAAIMPFTYSLPYIDIIIVIGIIISFTTTIIDIVKYNHKEYRIFGFGFLSFLAFSVIEILAINLATERVQGLYILIGLFVLLGFSIAQEAFEIRKIQHERDLATANANARTQFLANMSHEIRTPINSILGMNEIILKESDDPNITSYAQIVNDSGKLLLALIGDILDFSKIDSGKHEIINSPYRPKMLMENLCSIIKERAESKGLSVDYDISVNIPDLLYGDPKSISEVLLNLLSNAVKYTREGTISFTVNCTEQDDNNYILHFVVKDTGIGIKPEDFDKIFNPFSRTDLASNQNVQGTGLGLAITKQIVEDMGGLLTLKSDYGIGSSFMVTLPVRVPSDEELKTSNFKIIDGTYSQADIQNVSENYTAPNAKILVVDDNSTNIIVVKAFLKNSKIQITTADSGLKAFEQCCIDKFDVILMDHMMPGCDGIESMHMIKGSPTSLNQKTPIIILTANAIKGSDKEYLKEGFDNYLSKPVDSKLLLMMIRQYLPSEKVSDIES